LLPGEVTDHPVRRIETIARRDKVADYHCGLSGRADPARWVTNVATEKFGAAGQTDGSERS
jgi:hypothetical protein